MTHSYLSKRTVRGAALLLLFLLLLAAVPAIAAQRDRTPPTRPTNLHVTGQTAYSTALAWNPSSDNSGVFSYRVVISYGETRTVSQSQTSINWFVLVPTSTYSFYVYAIDGAGNRSQRSNTVTVTQPPDITPPTPPVLSLVDVNPTEASLEWTASTDDGPYLMYQVYVNGSPNVDTGTSRTAVVHNLTPQTTYDITVKARDFYGNPVNVSAPSNSVIVTTTAINPNDTEPPSPPANLYPQDIGDCAEIWVSWTQSFDNQTPQAGIRYEVYVNGSLEDFIVGDDQSIVYGQGGENSVTVIASDSAGNESPPVSANVTLCG
jgi:chitodextrinase